MNFMFEMKLFNANHRFSIDIIFFVKSTASPWADAMQNGLGITCNWDNRFSCDIL
jgi:hypothetical protein